jgi:hypothetical protein
VTTSWRRWSDRLDHYRDGVRQLGPLDLDGVKSIG